MRSLAQGASGGTVFRPAITVEAVSDPTEIQRFREHVARVRRNSDWLWAHWAEVAPRARGRFVAVAGEQAFVADTPEEARALATAAHPEDDAMLLQHVRPALGPRIYAHRR